ncbi:hypothetical protein B296_00010743 [Ensete ventricosum]|uniref:RING-type E3 ubiquitin transferase n=1 Tax=Ensete ventricosum TaxID=4639 RepID=A0A427AHG7_ENSVE|nr:hypothetical protein B296_00010743 [Ensete ventricosum]
MTNFKLGKKQIHASSSSGFQSARMDESPSLPMDSKSSNPKKQVQPPSKEKLPHGKSSLVLPNSDIDELLECPVCSNAMFPPIQQDSNLLADAIFWINLILFVYFFQCPSGHTLCFSCKNKVNNKCPICRKEIGNIRCLALEKLAVSLHLPCAYHHLGCEEMFPYYSKLQHETRCIYRPYTCPHPGSDCPFTSDSLALLSHLRERHKVDLQEGCTFNHRYVKQDACSVDSCSWTLTVSSAFCSVQINFTYPSDLQRGDCLIH